VGVHAPATHAVVPLAFAHATPHAPQFDVVAVEISQPLEARPSQLPNPALHAIAQVPEVHEGVPLLLLHA
jgi:hypothetical protein